jgi:hypothetical protein
MSTQRISNDHPLPRLKSLSDLALRESKALNRFELQFHAYQTDCFSVSGSISLVYLIDCAGFISLLPGPETTSERAICERIPSN